MFDLNFYIAFNLYYIVAAHWCLIDDYLPV